MSTIPLTGLVIFFFTGSYAGTIFALAIQGKIIVTFVILQWVVTLPSSIIIGFYFEYKVSGFIGTQAVCQFLITAYFHGVLATYDWT